MKPIDFIRFIPLLVLGAAAMLLSYYTPMVFDDWTFQRMYLECNGGSDAFSVDALKGFMYKLRSFDNGRLSNVTASAFAAVQWLHACFPVLTGATIAFLAWLICRIGISRRPGWKALTVSASFCLLALPWRDGLFAADYSLNYPYSAVITLCLIALLLRGMHHGFNFWLTLACLLTAVVTGWWHEGFALTTLAGGGVLTLCRRFRMPWQWYVAGAVCLTSTLLAFICHGMIARLERSVGVAGTLGALHVFVNMSPVMFMVGASILAVASKPFRERALRAIRSDVFILFASTALWGTIMSLSVEHSVRTSFWPTCASMVAVWKLYSCLPVPKLKFRIAVSLVLAAIAIFVAASAIIWQRKYWQEAHVIESMIDNTDERHIYFDIIGLEACPKYTLYIPVRHAWQSPLNMGCLSANKGRCIGIVPTELRSIRRERIKPLPGTAHMCRYGNSLIYLHTSDNDRLHERLVYTLIDGRHTQASEHYDTRFTNEDSIKMTFHKAWRIVATEVCQVDTMP